MARPHSLLPPRPQSPTAAGVGEDGLRSLLQTQLGVMNESVQDLAQRCVAESHVDGIWGRSQAPMSPWARTAPPKLPARSVHIAGMQETRQEEALKDSIRALQSSSIAMDGLSRKVDSLTDALIKIGTGLLHWSSHLAPVEQHGLVDVLLECLAPLATFDVRLQRLCAGLADGSSKTLAPLMSLDSVPGPCSHLSPAPPAVQACGPAQESRSMSPPTATMEPMSVPSAQSSQCKVIQAGPSSAQSLPASAATARSVSTPPQSAEDVRDPILKQLGRGVDEVPIPVNYFGTGAMHLAGTFTATSESRNGARVYRQVRMSPMTDVLLVLNEQGNWTACCTVPDESSSSDTVMPLAYLAPPS